MTGVGLTCRRLSAVGVCLLLLAATRPVLALDPSRRLSQAVHRIWQVQQGLPEATIYAVAQDADGYLWLGTESGLVRFDGVRFVPIDHIGALVIPRTRVQALALDAHQTLWVGTGDFGLLHLVAADRADRYLTTNGLPSNDIRCVVPEADHVWVCTAHGLSEIDRTSVTNLGVPANWGGPDVDAACVSPGGALWIGGDGPTLASWNGATFHARPLTSVGRLANVHALHCEPSGDLWVGTSAGLVHLPSGGGAEERTTTADGLADDDVLSLAGTRTGNLLVGTAHGFTRRGSGLLDSFGPADGLSQSSVYALFEDREGSVWVATKHGLNQFLDGRAVPYTTGEGLPSNDTGPVIQDHAGVIWVGTLDAGLSRFDGPKVSVLTTKDGLLSNTIRTLAVGADGDLWVGTDRGLDRLRDGHAVAAWTASRGLPDNRINAVVADPSGAVWIATGHGLSRFAPGADLSARPVSVLTGPTAAIGAERSGSLLAAPEGGGLDTLATGRPISALPAEAALRHVDAVFQDPAGAIWIGTIGDGLRLLDHGRLTAFHTSDGLFDDTIYGIVDDAHGRLWMACSKGIFSVSRADLLQFAAGTLHTFASTPYSPTDALRTIECKPGVEPALWRMRDGSLWFSTIRGVLTLDPAHLDRRLAPPPAVIEDVTVDGAMTPASELTTLSPGPRNLEFRYTGLSLVVPTRLTFKYRLVGFDPDWIDAGTRREAFYTNLSHGQFQFLVRACLPDGPCSEAPSEVALAIEPHLYEHRWFLPFLALAFAGAAWGLYHQRIRRLRANFALVLAERARIARELHDTLVQGFSGIAMGLRAVTDRLPASTERQTLEDIISDTGDCLRDARRTVAGLRGAEMGLAPAVEQAARQLTQGTPVTLGLQIAPCECPMPSSTEYHLVRIAHEAIANAIKHAEASSVAVSLESTPTRVRLRIEDDGRGFDAAAEPPGHYGLLGMRERAKEIGAALEFTSRPGQGTAVSVVWPSEA